MTDAFVGIDVAFAKGKRLPVVVCTRKDRGLVPFELRNLRELRPPVGRGNRIALEHYAVHSFAVATHEYLRGVERHYAIRIKRVAIDAPSCYKRDDAHRRAAELAMDERRVSCFATPSRQEFEKIKAKAKKHLNDGGPENRLPHANQLWMLVGFALFDELSKHYDCIEVFPQAIVDALQARSLHKSKRQGVTSQLSAVARHSGWPLNDDQIGLRQIAFGSRHDKLDAYLSAWVASLSEEDTIACGEAPSDVIWIPKFGKQASVPLS